jgi:hypothetical protein
MAARKNYADLPSETIWKIGQREFPQKVLARTYDLGIDTIRAIQRDQRKIYSHDRRFAPARIPLILGMSEDMLYCKSRPHGQKPAQKKTP